MIVGGSLSSKPAFLVCMNSDQNVENTVGKHTAVISGIYEHYNSFFQGQLTLTIDFH